METFSNNIKLTKNAIEVASMIAMNLAVLRSTKNTIALKLAFSSCAYLKRKALVTSRNANANR